MTRDPTLPLFRLPGDVPEHVRLARALNAWHYLVHQRHDPPGPVWYAMVMRHRALVKDQAMDDETVSVFTHLF